MNIVILENRVQNLLSADCGRFQLYFYKNLFDPYELSKIIRHRQLTKTTLVTLLNEIFSIDVSENQYVVKKFEEDHNLYFFYYRNDKKILRMTFRRIIKSHGIGEIFVDNDSNTCYMADHFSFNEKKEIPFLKLLLEFNSLFYKYEHELQNENIFTRIIIKELYQKNIQLLKRFNRIVELCDDLYCTVQMEDMVGAINNFYLFMENEPFEFFDWGEIKGIMDLILIELQVFKEKLLEIINILPYFIKIKNLIDISIIKKDFVYQLLYR